MATGTATATKKSGKGTKTPAKVQEQRDNAAAMEGGTGLLERLEADGAAVQANAKAGANGTFGVPNAAELLKGIEAEEQSLFAKFEAELKAKREAALAGLLEPLRAERMAAVQAWESAGQKIKDIDAAIATLTGQKNKKHAPAGGTGKRTRRTPEQKLEMARVVFDKMKASRGNKFKASELEQFAPGVPLRELVKIWNEAPTTAKGDQIANEGQKALSRYYLPI